MQNDAIILSLTNTLNCFCVVNSPVDLRGFFLHFKGLTRYNGRLQSADPSFKSDEITKVNTQVNAVVLYMELKTMLSTSFKNTECIG